MAGGGTEYVSQMAQFSSLEQMANLNKTMSFSQVTNWVGRIVGLNKVDVSGKQYAGIVKSVTRNGDVNKSKC